MLAAKKRHCVSMCQVRDERPRHLETIPYREEVLFHNVKNYDRNQTEGENGSHARDDNYCRSDRKNSLEISTKCLHQLLVDGVHVFAESINNSAHCKGKQVIRLSKRYSRHVSGHDLLFTGCGVEETHRGVQHSLKKVRKKLKGKLEH
jgi:hypothetical protein